MFIFGIQVDDDKMYRGIENRFSTVYSSLYLFIFLSSFFVKDISTTVKDRNFIFGIQNNNDKLYHGLENRLGPICSSLYLFIFLSLHTINTVIFGNRFLSNYLR